MRTSLHREEFRAATPRQMEAEFSQYIRTSGERTNRMVSFTSLIHQTRRLEDAVIL
jgi:hypothetical protein